MYAEISAEGWVLIIGSIGLIITQVLQSKATERAALRTEQRSIQNSDKIDNVQAKLVDQDKLVCEVKKDLLKADQQTKNTLNDVHRLVNTPFTAVIRDKSESKRKTAELYKRLAEYTGSEEHKADAVFAEAEAKVAETELARHLETDRVMEETARHATEISSKPEDKPISRC